MSRAGWRVEVAGDAAAVARRGAELLIDLARTKPGAHVALSGGSTPKAMYEVLRGASPEDMEALRQLHYHFGDERSVPNDHEESNVRLARDGFLGPLAIPEAHIHAPNGGATSLEDEADRLTRNLFKLMPSQAGRPVFDLIFLGMGTDGHTASLFPETKALRNRIPGFAANEVPQLATWRLTLTYPVLDTARRVAILATGANKAFVLGKIFQRFDDEDAVYPIEHLAGRDVLWLVDQDAARKIPGKETP